MSEQALRLEDGRAARKDGRAQRVCGPCCEDCVWALLRNCDDEGGPGDLDNTGPMGGAAPERNLWICLDSTCQDGSPVAPGKVVEYGGDCWEVTDQTSDDPPLQDRIPDREFECHANCDGCGDTASSCCDGGFPCGVLDEVYPYVTARWNSSMSMLGSTWCGTGGSNCAQVFNDNYPFAFRNYSHVTDFPGIDTPCIDDVTVSDTASFGPDPSPCPGLGSFNWGSGISTEAAYWISGGGNLRPPADDTASKVVIGTNFDIPGPNYFIRFVGTTAYAPGAGEFGFDFRAAISMSNPLDWWIYAEATSGDRNRGTFDFDANVSLVGCNQVVLSVSRCERVIPYSFGNGCLSNRSQQFSASGSVTVDYVGIVPCPSGRSGRFPSDGSVQAIERFLARDPMRGCRGCGG